MGHLRKYGYIRCHILLCRRNKSICVIQNDRLKNTLQIFTCKTSFLLNNENDRQKLSLHEINYTKIETFH